MSGAVRTIAAVAAGILIGIPVAEVGLRLAGVSHPRLGEYDPNRGSRRRGDIEWVHRSEGGARIRTNSLGFRDREHQTAKPPRTIRIAVLGDSQIEALQVELEDRLTERFERGLQRRFDADGFAYTVEVMNFGVSGYGTAEELLVYRHDVRRFRPDWVVLGFLSGNDVQNNARDLQESARRPYFVFEDDQLVLDTSFLAALEYRRSWKRELGRRAIDASRILQLLFEARNNWLNRRKKTALRESKSRPGQETIFLEEPGLYSEVYLEPADPKWRTAWRVTEAILDVMHREVKNDGAGFVLVTLTNAAQVHPDATVRRELTDFLGCEDLFYPDDRLAALGAREGFPVVNLARGFRQIAERDGVYLHGFENTVLGRGHWNELGHRLAADRLVEEFVQLIRAAEPVH